jgi:hypothetical protein
MIDPERDPRIAAALAGDREALAEVLPGFDPSRRGARLGVLLAHRAARADPPVAVPDPLRALRKRVAATWIMIERDLADLGRVLGDAGVGWAPFKGADVARRLYPDPGLRAMTDIDLLVRERDYRRAREALEADGWTNAAPGARFDRYVEEEGSAWTGSRPGSPLVLELHLRFWGFVPDGLGDAILERAEPWAPDGPSARRLRLADAFVLAAVHPWLHLPPRSLANWWELHRFLDVGGPELADEAAELTEAHGLHLPVHLSAARVAELWDGPPAALASRLARRLAGGLRRSERFTARRARARHPDRVPIEWVAAARLLARRPSRSGLAPVWRRIWAHPGIVERLTPERWSWPRRRAVHVLQCLGLLPRPRADWWRAPTHGHRARDRARDRADLR